VYVKRVANEGREKERKEGKKNGVSFLKN